MLEVIPKYDKPTILPLDIIAWKYEKDFALFRSLAL
jgi:hypothetical protein